MMLGNSHRKIFRFSGLAGIIAVTGLLLLPDPGRAIPAFARKYGVSCSLCHGAFPRLNHFGEKFAADNYRLPNWKEAGTVAAGDDRLALPERAPLALRTQAFVQMRQAEEIDPVTGPTGKDAELDFQAPYLIKLLSGAPLSEHITYYFYGIFAEKGGNGETIIEDAWFSYSDLFGTGVDMMLGQFQVSDLMFPRELRLTFQDFMVYRMAGITYDRGMVLTRGLGPLDLALGAVNGNGITQNFSINSPGYKRPDHMFDNDTDKSIFGRMGAGVGPVNIGIFGLAGKQKNVTGPAGTVTGDRKGDRLILGLDLSGDLDERLYWFVQMLWNRWEDFILENKDYEWYGGFAGIDYVYSDRWLFSILYNYADANDLDDTSTVYEGIDINSLTVGTSYYFMRNMKLVAEANVDMLPKDDDADFVGHETKENYFLIGFDAAF